MTPKERIAELERARTMLLQASESIRECLHMSGMERRFGDLPDRICALADSPEENSLANLVREIEAEGDGSPNWTRPFDSPKNDARKLIK